MATTTALLVSGVLLLSAYLMAFAIAGVLTSSSDGTIRAESSKRRKARFLVLVPANNEGEYLRATLRNLRALDYPKDHFHIVTIADNCTDDTALIATQEGCEVWLRNDPDRRGKGHALSWALSRVETTSYDAAAVVDADTTCSPNLLHVFDREIEQESGAIQVRIIYDFVTGTPRWLSLVSHATQRGEDLYVTQPRSRFHLYQGLQGTGFCLTTQVLKAAPWNANSICEDLEYGFELAKHGISIRFVTDATVTAVMTGKFKHASAQRERWARGTYALIAKLLPVQFMQAVRRLDWKSLESCFYLAVRSRIPLLVLTVLSGVFLVIERHHSQRLWWILFGTALLLQCAYVVAILSTVRAESSLGRMVFRLFIYLAWILRQHFGALLNLRHAHWSRTERS